MQYAADQIEKIIAGLLSLVLWLVSWIFRRELRLIDQRFSDLNARVDELNSLVRALTAHSARGRDGT